MNSLVGRAGLALVLVLVAASGCSSTLLAARPARSLTPAALEASPDAYQGQTVLLGGTIVATRPRPDGLDIEIAGRPLDGEGRPERGDSMIGHFIVRSDGPLDPAAYPPGRSITAVGQVAPMASWWDYGDPARRYPVLTRAELLFWPPNTTTGGVFVGRRYWVWPYAFPSGPPPYVPLVISW